LSISTRDVHVEQPHLAVVDLGEAVHERGSTRAQRLHLGADQNHAGLVGRLDVVVVPRLLVLRDDLGALLACHAGQSLRPPQSGF
jgi:hypothetical protein